MSDLGEREERERYTYTYIHTHTHTTQHTTIYIPKAFRYTYDMLLGILDREDKTFSEWIRDNAESYVRLHEPGNPQQRLDTILRLGKAYHAPSKICGFKDCLRDVVKVGIFLQTKKEYGLCEKHLKEAKENKQIWKIL